VSDPGDRVRLEVTHAPRRDVRVVPVLVGGAVLPDAAHLPEDLHRLQVPQAVVLHQAGWHRDVEGLVAALRQVADIGPLARWVALNRREARPDAAHARHCPDPHMGDA
jgi:hypothetical protein